jgi:hypothetical protein
MQTKTTVKQDKNVQQGGHGRSVKSCSYFANSLTDPQKIKTRVAM